MAWSLVLLFLAAGTHARNLPDYGSDGLQLCDTSDDCTVLNTDCVLGECVMTDSIECPEHMYYSECLNRCKNCRFLNGAKECVERDYCIEGCECVDGYVWDDETGTCLSVDECKSRFESEQDKIRAINASCPLYAVYDPCPSPCGARTCENLETPCPFKGCDTEKRCSCRRGFVQVSKNVSDGCIPEGDCVPVFAPTEEPFEASGEELGALINIIKPRDPRADACPLHSQLQDCVPRMPVNCYSLDTAASMPFECGTARCECETGFVRSDSGDEAPCVPKESCPVHA